MKDGFELGRLKNKAMNKRISQERHMENVNQGKTNTDRDLDIVSNTNQVFDSIFR